MDYNATQRCAHCGAPLPVTAGGYTDPMGRRLKPHVQWSTESVPFAVGHVPAAPSAVEHVSEQRTLPPLTQLQVLERRIANDTRNVADLAACALPSMDLVASVIAECAKRLFQARACDKELERRAEENLRDALEFWISL
jgi:hypothetical protein